ncbi:MAG: hypothetical protein K6G18_14740 [Treponema sp.]|nr:hypothetical protein [Treponema sp.]
MESSAGDKIIAQLSEADRAALQGRSGEQERDIYVFFSFDLVGSTKFKTDEQEKWPYVIFKFYELTYNELKNKIPRVAVWKYLGDEVLLYISLHAFGSDHEIYKIPENVFSVQSSVSKVLQALFPGEKLRIDIKSTIWIAGTVMLRSEEFIPDKMPLAVGIYRNLKMKLSIGDQTQDDFIGPDMDTGFRVAKHAHKNMVVLSADFAYLLYRMKKPRRMKGIDGNMKIVSLEILKGVWDDKYYPIVWYCDDWKTAEKNFPYAAYKENTIVAEVLSGCTEPVSYLERIYDELDKTESADEFVDECEKIISLGDRKTVMLET